MEYSIVTPTGNRAEHLLTCKRYIERQTMQPKEWIIVDDGSTPIPDSIQAESWVRCIQRVPVSDDPIHSVARNVAAALSVCKSEYILNFEDDDWYAPDHAQQLLKWLVVVDIVGQVGLNCYHVPARKWFNCGNRYNAAWCQTGFRDTVAPLVLEVCTRPGVFKLDFALWKDVWARGVPCRLLPPTPPTCIGIKGLSARGLTQTHDPECELYVNNDPNLDDLYGWIGEDVELYATREVVNA